MILLAVLDRDLAAGISSEQAARDPAARDLQVVWSGEHWQALLDAKLDVAPDVVVLDRTQLPVDVSEAVQAIRKRLGARTVITTYGFAPARDIDALRRAGSDVVVQGPLSVRSLRTLLLSMLIERRMSTSPAPTTLPPRLNTAATSRDPTPPPGKSVEDGPVVPPRFSRQTLLALRDMSTSIQCECPNHVAELVERLIAFEAYSKTCENRDDDDAHVHRTLWFASARARRIMEDALELLLKHERLTIVNGTLLRSA